MKSDKMPYIYADTGSFIKRTNGCANNPENSSTTKMGEPVPCRYSMLAIWAFDHRNHRGKDCMKKLCECLTEHVKNIIDFEKKEKMLSLTKEECKSYQNAKLWYICGKES